MPPFIAANADTNERHSSHETLADFSANRRLFLLSGLALAAGGISSLVAYALLWLIAVITNLSFYQQWSSAASVPQGHHLGAWVIIVPVIGALIIGLMARYGSEKIRGHGIPEAMEAILLGRSRIQLRVALLKPLSAAISIGTGGPFGAEGPIIMTGGAFGSLFAQCFHLSSAERKTLLVAGAAAGMTAIFSTPVAAVLLAIELLLFEWKPRSFIPVVLAVAVASVLRVPLLGVGPLFPVHSQAAITGTELLCAGSVGLIVGLGASLITSLMYGLETSFQKLPVHWMWWPAIGALFIGVGGWIEPRVLGVGYDTIHHLLRGELAGAALFGLFLAKALVWSIALGSGTSGGVLAPLLIMGGSLGALVGQHLPVGSTGLWALIGMAAMMSGSMGAPLTAMLFAAELTGEYQQLPALMTGCALSYAVTVLLMKRSILTEKLARRGQHITREYSIDPFELARVREVMDKQPAMVLETMKLTELADRIAAGDQVLGRRQATLLVDEHGLLSGIITRGDMVRALSNQTDPNMTVGEAGSMELVVTYPHESLHQALTKMLSHDVGRLPVVDPTEPRRLLGYLGRAAILSARWHWHEQEHLRQRG